MRNRKYTLPVLLAFLAIALTISGAPVQACHDGSPLILDLDGDGVRTTSTLRSVRFDIDDDGIREAMAWTFWESEEAFLWLDLNRNQVVDSGAELFGDATLNPVTGDHSENGFEALAVYDRSDFGGDEDGTITPMDLVWGHLRLWVDRNHDGLSQRSEISTLSARKVVAIGLDYVQTDRYDGSMNIHRYEGSFVMRTAGIGGMVLETRALDDVFFKIVHEEE